jgi:hypothetical protein
MTDQDIYAFRPVPEAVTAPPARRRLWPWFALAFALLALLVGVACVAALWSLADSAQHGLHIRINGDDWDPMIVGGDHWASALLGVGAATVAVLVIVPVALLLALLATALGVGLALLAVLAVLGSVALVAALALSPLWLLGLLLWLLLRRRAPDPARMTA